MPQQSETKDVNALIDGQNLSAFQVVTIILCGCAAVLDGFDTQMIGFLAPAIAESLGTEVRLFAPVFSAGLFGLMIGALVLGPVADRLGRRWTVIAATFTFGLFTFLTASVGSIEELVVLRFLTGLGLGGAMPNLISLATEYSPKRHQGMIVAWLFAGIPIGAILGGLLSAWLLPLAGWQAVFHVGGVLPMALALLLVFALPESVRFLIAKGAPQERILAIMRKVAPQRRFSAEHRFTSAHVAVKGAAVRRLFTEGRAAGTVLLWVPYFMNLLIIYFIISWMPAVLRQGGMPLSAGIAAATAFSAGGAVGCLITGRLLRVFGARNVVFIEFAAAIALIALLAFNATAYAQVLVITTALGFVVQGAQAGLNALVAGFYPTEIRSTGIGWALGVGRIGSIAGPLVGGLMLSLDWPISTIFLASVIPAAIAAAAVLIALLQQRGAVADDDPAPQVILH